ncbi:SMP-30/gluconolactonase/LRE family protein [Muriicola sp. Z0-33]|uniref:SMP-30/gluconolactonase/LRE family protein n=1 Tax=Muriicola sp. Z0-33 TaxID=2816957 RepID=UPI002237680F|nr:SMP-30/gluconolactonase/LRE family protein [Muriicola sp. Z0-33]MCW5517529.1 SMP-30/gluconolactonase/LRE family protein [Muriicola sp. Z0-33]
MKYIKIIAVFFIAMSCKEKKETVVPETDNSSITYPILEGASIAANSEALWDIVSKEAKIEILAEGHYWTEGPLWVEQQQMLLYTDIPRNAIYVWKEGKEAEVYLEPSGFLGENFTGGEPGANGLLLDSEGALVLCQHGERRMAKMNSTLDAPKPSYTALVAEYNQKRFNSPNDAAYRNNGDLYFTDPPYGLPERMDDPAKELDFQGVYRLDTEGELTLLTKEFTRPNGIAFSLDSKQLYVANSDPEQAIWKVFEIKEDGTLGSGKLFYDATDLVGTEKGLPDGLKVDRNGNIFATGPGGVFIFTPEGEVLGKIKTGRATSNCAFNADKSVLFITADSYILRVKLTE